MELIGLTEERLTFHDFLARHAHAVPARRGFYIALYPNKQTNRRLVDGLDALRTHAPGPEDVVFLDASNENSRRLDDDAVEALAAFNRETGVPRGRVVLVAQGSGLPREDGARREPMNWLAYHHWPVRLARTYEAMELTDFSYDALADAPPRFLMLNRTVRPHRYLLMEAIRRSALSQVVLRSDHRVEGSHSPRRMAEDVARNFPRLAHLAPDRDAEGWSEGTADFDDRQSAAFGRLGPMPVSFPEAPVRATMLSIVTETDFRAPVVRVTEKSFKPFVTHRPFVLVAAPRSLALLRDFGFATFGAVIDESYDNVVEPEDRLIAVLVELERLRRALEAAGARRAFLDAAREACAHNQRHLQQGFVEELDRQTLRTLRYALARPPPTLFTAACEGIA